MRSLLLMAFVVFGSPAFSVTKKAFSIVPRSGEYTCNRLGDLKYDCLTIIENRFVDEWASGALDRYESTRYTLDGMYIIVDRSFQQNAVVACDRFVSALDTNQCLEAIANCSYSNEAVASCDAEASTAATLGCFRYHCNK